MIRELYTIDCLTVCLTKPIYIFVNLALNILFLFLFPKKLRLVIKVVFSTLRRKFEYFTTCTEGNMDQVNYNGKDPRIDPEIWL